MTLFDKKGMSLSNLNGRLLEYIIVLGIKHGFEQEIIFTKQTIHTNERDKPKLTEINDELLNHFRNSTTKIIEWISTHFHNNNPITLHRLTDEEGKKGDVTDIRLTSDDFNLNLSIKNNHLATKHQRPGPTPKHIGLDSNDSDFLNFKKEYTTINKVFYESSKKVNPEIKLYNEVEDLKFDNLYEPICSLVSNLLNKHSNKSNLYQTFLLGIVDFKKIILFKDRIEIRSFDNIPKPNKMNSWVENKSYVKVDFNNNVILSMRLHTASSRISETGSLKFDTKIQTINIPSIIIKL
jgi:hypothetical protein